MFKQFALSVVVLGTTALIPALASADDVCRLAGELALRDARLSTTVTVTPRVASQMQEMGIPLHSGLMGGQYVRTEDVMDYLKLTDCDPEMMALIVQRATLIARADDLGSGGSSTPAAPSEPDNGNGNGDYPYDEITVDLE